MQKKVFAATAVVAAIVVFVVLTLVRNSATAPSDDYVLRDGLLETPVTVRGTTYLVPEAAIYDSGRTPEDLPALTDPAMTTAAAMDAVLGDELLGIDVEVAGKHRFYPYQIMNWHYVVNETSFNGASLIVTYDALTGAAQVYESSVVDGGGEQVRLSASGSVYENSMLLSDGSGSFWWATRGIAVTGRLAGKTLRQYPSTVMRWADWRDAYGAAGEVLSNETGHVRDYSRHPYGSYDTTMTVYFPMAHLDTRIEGTKWFTYGLVRNGEAMAFTRNHLVEVRVANETVGGEQVVAFYDEAYDLVRVFAAKSGDRQLTFTYDEEIDRITDNETGSVWSVTGVAKSGKLKGETLDALPTSPMFWFAWSSMFPETKIAAESALSEDKSNTNAAD